MHLTLRFVPYLNTADDYESMLPWKIKREAEL
jgi:hypothetical protein